MMLNMEIDQKINEFEESVVRLGSSWQPQLAGSLGGIARQLLPQVSALGPARQRRMLRALESLEELRARLHCTTDRDTAARPFT